MKTGCYALLVIFIILFRPSYAQEKMNDDQDESFPFIDKFWTLENVDGTPSKIKTTQHKGRNSIVLEPGQTAFLKEQKFKNFELEFYCNGQFPGVGFRIQDKKTFEYLYLRVPMSGYQDAIQYVPIYNGSLPWQLYNYPKYEGKANFPKELVANLPKSFESNLVKGTVKNELLDYLKKNGISFSQESLIDFTQEGIQYIFDPKDKKALLIEKEIDDFKLLDFRTWIHVKLVVLGDTMSIYIEDMDSPSFTVNNLKGISNSGGISLISDFDQVYFSDVSIKEIQAPKNNNLIAYKTLPNSYLNRWKASEPFVKDSIAFLDQVDSLKTIKGFTQSIEADGDGLINISRFYEDMSKTVILTNTLISDSDRTIGLHFDYADYLVVLMNSKVLFDKGMNFQPPANKGKEGRVFVDDEQIRLELKKGPNELIFMLSGDNRQKYNWGFTAKLESWEGIKIE
ncbi:hypothetical protein [Maribacter aurantiacus]|uniref:DUF1080 domain-containing protein n=1 Tax=Maribacter aurantiacus TaxID=1882343 RepID=A0A5R8M0L7_9FLAO|nr:hypothetical protein [Maribacter aurantiacus]TLF43192.1 hypothetical protein FEK29_13845 [Maribacter aurantiacus]